MNVIFRGNGERKARERQQEEAAPAEEVFSSQTPRCAARERDRYREEEEEAAAAARLAERERASAEQVRDGREKQRVQPKAPRYVSRLHSHQSHTTVKRKEMPVLGWCLKSYVNKAH